MASGATSSTIGGQTELGGPRSALRRQWRCVREELGVARTRAEADVLDETANPLLRELEPTGAERPFPHMLRTVWGDPARYDRDWQTIPGCLCDGRRPTKDKDDTSPYSAATMTCSTVADTA